MEIVPAVPAGQAKTRLLEAAIRCIQDKGYSATTAREVAGLADANLASIGYHFGGMGSLLDEALIVATERWIEPLIEMAKVGDNVSSRERVLRGLLLLVNSLPEHRNTVIGFFEALARVERSDPLRRRFAASYDQLRSAIAGTVPHDEVSRETAMTVASAVIALYDGVIVQWLIDPARPVDVQTMVDGLGGLLAQPAATTEAIG